MFKMCCQRSVERSRRPAIGIGANVFHRAVSPCFFDAMTQLRTDVAEHRLDRQHHPLAQLDTASALAVVVDLRVLVHPSSDSVSYEIADDVETARLGVFLNRRADVAEMIAGTHLFDGVLQALTRRVAQL